MSRLAGLYVDHIIRWNALSVFITLHCQSFTLVNYIHALGKSIVMTNILRVRGKGSIEGVRVDMDATSQF